MADCSIHMCYSIATFEDKSLPSWINMDCRKLPKDPIRKVTNIGNGER